MNKKYVSIMEQIWDVCGVLYCLENVVNDVQLYFVGLLFLKISNGSFYLYLQG